MMQRGEICASKKVNMDALLAKVKMDKGIKCDKELSCKI